MTAVPTRMEIQSLTQTICAQASPVERKTTALPILALGTATVMASPTMWIAVPMRKGCLSTMVVHHPGTVMT